MVDLEAYDELYDGVEAGSEFDPVPDGTYQVFIEEITMGETKKEPTRPMLSWQLKIMNGDQEGKLLFKNAVVNISSTEDTERSLKFIKTDLSICGLECKFSEIQGHLHKLLNAQLEVKVVTKTHKGKPIQNIWVQRALGADEVQDDGEIPF